MDPTYNPMNGAYKTDPSRTFGSVRLMTWEQIEAAEISTLCCCIDPVHPGDNEQCPVHGRDAAGSPAWFAAQPEISFDEPSDEETPIF
jgi:hypothetical protein